MVGGVGMGGEWGAQCNPWVTICTTLFPSPRRRSTPPPHIYIDRLANFKGINHREFLADMTYDFSI